MVCSIAAQKMCLGSSMETFSGLGYSKISTGLGSRTTHRKTPVVEMFFTSVAITAPTNRRMPTKVIHWNVLLHSSALGSGGSFAAPALQTCHVPSCCASLASTKIATCAGPGLWSTWRLGLPPAAGVASTAVRWLSSRSTQFVEASTPWSIGAAGKEKDHLSVVGEGEKSKTTSMAAGPVAVPFASFQYAMWFLSALAAGMFLRPASTEQDLRMRPKACVKA
mmetsp:Transcript_67315/g.188457  ORF Transcript_67315/g.188457 Transcript_67315/m.188457 type:complete len:222 (+) Transcript_67315:855-1520(+)